MSKMSLLNRFKTFRQKATLINGLASHDEAGYSLPLVIAAALILIAGTAVLANRAGLGLLSAVFQNQSWEAREAAEIGMTQIVSELNKETNRYLMVRRPGDTGDGDGIWTASSNAYIKATRTNPCTGATEPSYSNLDARTTSTASDTSYGVWYIQDTGEITRNKGTATRGFKLSYVKRQAIANNGSPLNIYTNRPSGTGELTLQVQGFAYRGTTEAATAKLEKVFELVPKCCKVSFGAAHGALDYGISYGTNNDETICLNSAASLGLGLVAGAGMEGGSMRLIGDTSVTSTNNENVSPVICIVTASNPCTGTTTGNVSTQIAKVDITLPPVKTYAQAFASAPSSETAGKLASTTGDLSSCDKSREICPSNSAATRAKDTTSSRFSNFTYCVYSGSNCNYTIVNGDASSSKLPSFCIIGSDNNLHCNINQLTYDQMIFATGGRKILLYFPNSDTGTTQNDYVIYSPGNSWLKNCPISASSLTTEAEATGCSPASGANIANLSMFGCATNTCILTGARSTGTQTVSIKGTSDGTGLFTYFPEGVMKLNGTPNYQGIMWGKSIDAGGTVNFIIPASGLASVCSLMGVCRANEGSGTGNGQLPSYDFVARSTNRYRWL